MRNAPLRGVSLVNTLITLAAIEVAAAQAVLFFGCFASYVRVAARLVDFPMENSTAQPALSAYGDSRRFRLSNSNVFPDVRFKPAFRQDPVDIPYEI